MFPRRRARAERTVSARADLALAEKSLERASTARDEQAALRRRERETLIARLDRLAAGNHLAEKLLEAFTERSS
jgi:hypothetical protein